jgi:hypothetical protein
MAEAHSPEDLTTYRAILNAISERGVQVLVHCSTFDMMVPVSKTKIAQWFRDQRRAEGARLDSVVTDAWGEEMVIHRFRNTVYIH